MQLLIDYVYRHAILDTGEIYRQACAIILRLCVQTTPTQTHKKNYVYSHWDALLIHSQTHSQKAVSQHAQMAILRTVIHVHVCQYVQINMINMVNRVSVDILAYPINSQIYKLIVHVHLLVVSLHWHCMG